MNVTANILQTHSDINGVYAANDKMAMDVLSVLKAKNLNKKVILVGNDGNTENFNTIESCNIYKMLLTVDLLPQYQKERIFATQQYLVPLWQVFL